MRKLKLAENLFLPLDFVTQTLGILAKRGVGKTYAALKLAEETLKAGLRIVVIDPIGVWWGLRANADGKREGLSIVVFGGDHADVPLESTSGELIADLIIKEKISIVLDLSHFRKAEQNRFMTVFCERLYQKNREALHVFLDEADAFAPQRPQRGEERMLGALEDIVRRGRARGLGVTLITQRSAVLNKNVLTQIEALMVMRTTAPNDRNAIDQWIELNGDQGKRKQMMESLASLAIGEAWFWSPGWLDVFKKIKVSRRETFDSSATPKVGVRVRKPKKLAKVDINRIKDMLVDTVKKAEQEDPRLLKKKIAELQYQLTQRPTKAREVIEKIKTVFQKVPVLGKRDSKRLLKAATMLKNSVDDAKQSAKEVVEALAPMMRAFENTKGSVPISTPRPTVVTKEKDPQPLKDSVHSYNGAFTTVNENGQDQEYQEAIRKLRAGERKMIEVLFRVQPTPLTRTQLGTLSGYAPGGTFSAYYSTLRRLEIIKEVNDVTMLDKVPKEVIPLGTSKPITTEEVIEMWKRSMRLGERKMLDILLKETKEPSSGLTREELSEKSGYAIGGTFSAYLSTLHRNGLVDFDGDLVRISESVFLGVK